MNLNLYEVKKQVPTFFLTEDELKENLINIFNLTKAYNLTCDYDNPLSPYDYLSLTNNNYDFIVIRDKDYNDKVSLRIKIEKEVGNKYKMSPEIYRRHF